MTDKFKLVISEPYIENTETGECYDLVRDNFGYIVDLMNSQERTINFQDVIINDRNKKIQSLDKEINKIEDKFDEEILQYKQKVTETLQKYYDSTKERATHNENIKWEVFLIENIAKSLDVDLE